MLDKHPLHSRQHNGDYKQKETFLQSFLFVNMTPQLLYLLHDSTGKMIHTYTPQKKNCCTVTKHYKCQIRQNGQRLTAAFTSICKHSM